MLVALLTVAGIAGLLILLWAMLGERIVSRVPSKRLRRWAARRRLYSGWTMLGGTVLAILEPGGDVVTVPASHDVANGQYVASYDGEIFRVEAEQTVRFLNGRLGLAYHDYGATGDLVMAAAGEAAERKYADADGDGQPTPPPAHVPGGLEPGTVVTSAVLRTLAAEEYDDLETVWLARVTGPGEVEEADPGIVEAALDPDGGALCVVEDSLATRWLEERGPEYGVEEILTMERLREIAVDDSGLFGLTETPLPRSAVVDLEKLYRLAGWSVHPSRITQAHQNGRREQRTHRDMSRIVQYGSILAAFFLGALVTWLFGGGGGGGGSPNVAEDVQPVSWAIGHGIDVLVAGVLT